MPDTVALDQADSKTFVSSWENDAQMLTQHIGEADAGEAPSRVSNANQQAVRSRWSKEENEAISLPAAQMREQISLADIAQIRADLENMSPQQRELMAEKNVDSVDFFFYTKAS